MNVRPELVAALDFPRKAPALRVARTLGGSLSWVKVGLELFSAEGPRVVDALKDLGFKVFLDLKLHDIPNTVRGAVLAAGRLGADMLTIHLQGGERAIRAAIEAAAAAEHRPLLFGVTVLTSTAPGELFGVRGGQRAIASAVVKLARSAQDWGLDGVVCSGKELPRIKQATDLLCLTPGIRPAQAGGTRDDQRRTVTPAQAVRAGADYLVVGRPITEARDPAAAAVNILEAMRRAASSPQTRGAV